MSQTGLHFRVGLFTLFALAVTIGLVFQFGELRTYWQPSYTLTVRFSNAPGVSPATRVEQQGVVIGEVSRVTLDPRGEGVDVELRLRENVRIPRDSTARLSRTLLGGSIIEIVPGESVQSAAGGTRLVGEPPTDLAARVERIEKQVSTSLETLNRTGDEWRKVGENLNALLGNNRKTLDLALAKTVESLDDFRKTMSVAQKTIAKAGSIFADPEIHKNLKLTASELPKLLAQTKTTLAAAKGTLENINGAVTNLEQITDPLAKQAPTLAKRVNATMANIEVVSGDLAKFSAILSKKDGTLTKLASDPTLYQNLNASARQLAILLRNVQPILKDVNIFSDKIARHPELLGIRGMMRPSSGLKDPPPRRIATPVGFPSLP